MKKNTKDKKVFKDRLFIYRVTSSYYNETRPHMVVIVLTDSFDHAASMALPIFWGDDHRYATVKSIEILATTNGENTNGDTEWLTIDEENLYEEKK